MEAPVSVEVFCSYAHEDKTWLCKLETHLSLLKQQGLISLWHNRLIVPGTDWANAIDTHLETASVILLLISANFLASNYCYGTEMKRALERHEAGEAHVIPIIVRPVDWRGAPFAHLQALPFGAKPLASWRDEDRALADVVASIRQVAGELTGHSDQGPYATQPRVWNVPHARNPYFTGRDELLNRLHQQLTPTGQNDPVKFRKIALTQPYAIKGLGGIGKTQIAVEYAYRSYDLDRYTHTLWVNAASEETIMTSFREIAALLPSFSAANEIDQQKLVEAIKRWLEQCKHRWLLIFDNADDLPIIQRYLPRMGNGSILFTTRANAVGSLAESIEAENMGLTEGTQFLLRRAQRLEHASDEETNKAMNVVMALDCFPLALDQAGAYIEETQCGFSDYLQEYQNHRKTSLARRGLQATNYPDSVATTWSLSFQKIEHVNPAAAELLRLCAFLDPDKIPEELIIAGAPLWSPLLQQAITDLSAFNQMIAELLKFSLVQRLVETQTLRIHRLVQAVQIDMMELERQNQWAERVVRAVNEVFPRELNVNTWPQCLRYLSQVQVCNMLIEQYMLSLIEAAALLSRTASYLVEHALYTVAEPLYQRSLALCEQQLGPEHPDTAHALHSLAHLYYEQGKYEQAEQLFQRTLHIWEQTLGPDHSNVAHSLHGLASLHRKQGKYEQAEQLCQRVLHIGEQELGPDHPNVAHSLHGLAHIYEAQGKYEQAEVFYQRALRIREKTLGHNHHSVAQSMHGLASIYRRQGKYEQAEPLFQQTLSIWEHGLGEPDHPNIAHSLHGLAHIYEAQGKYEQAESHFLRALTICEKCLGVEHPEVAAILRSLAIFYQNQGRFMEAEQMCQRSMTIYEQTSGQASLDMGKVLGAYAYLLLKRRKIIKAAQMSMRGLKILGLKVMLRYAVEAARVYGKRILWKKQ